MMKINVKVKKKIGYGSRVMFDWIHKDMQAAFNPGGGFTLGKAYTLVSDRFLIFKEDDNGTRKNGWGSVPYNNITGECKQKIKILAKIKLVEDETKGKG